MGPAIGCVVDGCPPGYPLIDRRTSSPGSTAGEPGQSRFTTQRREDDEVRILSGIFDDERTPEPVTTGTPIAC